MPGSDDRHARTKPVALRRRSARRLWCDGLWISILLIALTALRVSLVRSALAADDEIVWKPVGVGLEEAHFQLPGNAILGPSIVAIRASLREIRPRVIRAAEYGWKKASVKTLCKATGARACINSNFFDEQGKPLGLIISRGILHQKPHNGGGTLTGIFFVAADGAHIIHRSSFTPEGVIEATQAGPRLISEGAPVVGLKTPRLHRTYQSLASIKRSAFSSFALLSPSSAAPSSKFRICSCAPRLRALTPSI